MVRSTRHGRSGILFHGDNLAVLREHITDESVDLIYLDPPFNSQRSYKTSFRAKINGDPETQIQAFDDCWRWCEETESTYADLTSKGRGIRLREPVVAF